MSNIVNNILKDVNMSNIFKDVLDDASAVQDEYLGPTYPYYQNIKTPSQLGMSPDGTLKQLGNNITGLIDYVEILATGTTPASKTGKPLGNKFFLPTGAKCIDLASKKQVQRYIYVNNVPTGNIPIISSALGTDFSEFKGLIPGAMGNLNVLNPFAILSSFMSGSTPPCRELTMQTIDVNNQVSTATHFVTLTDIKNMDPCIFPNGVNIERTTDNKCVETFQNTNSFSSFEQNFPRDPLTQVYFASLTGIGLFILYRLMEKSK